MARIFRSRNRSGKESFLWVATTVLLLAAVMRLIMIQDIPPGLSQDEVLNADIVNIIRSGRYALFFREGYGHEPLYHYWATPFQILLGDNVLSIRLPASFLGLLLVALTVRWIKRDFGSLAAIMAGIGLAVSWWTIIFSRIGIRPILEPILIVLAVWFWPKRSWLGGLFLGLAAYSYTAGRYSFLIALLMAAYLVIFHRTKGSSDRRADKFESIKSALIVFLVSLAMTLPLLLLLQKDPGLEQRVEQLSGPLQSLRNGDFRPIMQSVIATLGFFGFTGDPRWTYTIPGRPIFGPVVSVVFLLGLATAIWRWRQPAYALVLIWLVIALIPSAVTPDAPSTVRLVGAMPLVYLMPGIALTKLRSWFQQRQLSLNVGPRILWIGITIMLIGLASAMMGQTIGDGFIRWPASLETRLKYQAVMLDIARFWKEHPVSQLVIAESFFEPIDADSFQRSMDANPSTRWIQSGAAVDGALLMPAILDDAYLFVPEYAPIAMPLLQASGISPDPLYRSERSPSFAVYEFPSEYPTPSIPQKIAFENLIEFLGYDLLKSTDDTIHLLTYWEVKGPLPPDLSFFLHLVTKSGTIVSQKDNIDIAPELAIPGDIVIQSHILEPGEDTEKMPRQLRIGLYRRGDGTRLRTSESGGDFVVLDQALTFDPDELDR